MGRSGSCLCSSAQLRNGALVALAVGAKGRRAQLKAKKLKELFELYWAWKVEGLLTLPEDLPLGVAESYPAWFDDRAHEGLGAQWPILARAMNQPAQVILRTNTLRATRDELLERLASEGIEAEASTSVRRQLC